jgi:hypothetical protein
MATDDPQDLAEALDDDKLDEKGPQDEDRELDYVPPDAPVASLDYGVTDREQAIDEPIEERAERWEPDPLVEELDREAEERP